MKRNQFLKNLMALPFIGLVFKKEYEATKSHSYSVNGTFFTPEMLTRHNYGLFIINTKAGSFEDIKKRPGYAATVAFKLGYNNHRINSIIGAKVVETFQMKRYGRINFLTDGWFAPMGDTYEEVCDYLNNNPYGEKYRLMSKEEVIYLLTVRNQGFL